MIPDRRCPPASTSYQIAVPPRPSRAASRGLRSQSYRQAPPGRCHESLKVRDSAKETVRSSRVHSSHDDKSPLWITEVRRYMQETMGPSSGCRSRVVFARAAAQADAIPIGVGEIADVESVDGIRVLLGENNTPRIEYLVKWKVSGLSTGRVSNHSLILLSGFRRSSVPRRTSRHRRGTLLPLANTPVWFEDLLFFKTSNHQIIRRGF